MILEYHRPQTLTQALDLLARETPLTIPLGGGTRVSRQAADVAVVDLQALGLDRIEVEGGLFAAGATATLEQIYQHAAAPAALKEAIHLDATLNLRNAATIAGIVAAGDGLSACLAVLLALDAHLAWQPGGESQAIGDYLALRHTLKPGRLITQISFSTQAAVQFAAVGRSPLDRPLVSVAAARWSSGRLRIAIGGETPIPVLALDGIETGEVEAAALNACARFDTRWSSSEYRDHAVGCLLKRVIPARTEEVQS